MEHGYKMFVTE